MPSKYLSRKFLMALGAALTAAGAALSGEVSWTVALSSISTAVVAYVAGETAIDITAMRTNQSVTLVPSVFQEPYVADSWTTTDAPDAHTATAQRAEALEAAAEILGGEEGMRLQVEADKLWASADSAP